MDEQKRKLQGSEARDIFKRMHKEKLGGSFYGLDLDFMVVEKKPINGIAAIFDYKKNAQDTLSFTEVIAFNEFTFRGIDCFVIEGDPSEGPFLVKRYAWGDPIPNPPLTRFCQKKWELETWEKFGEWEAELRSHYKKRFSV